MSLRLLLLILILGLPLVGALLALFLRRVLPETGRILLAALAFFGAGVALIFLVRLPAATEDLGEALPLPQTAQGLLRPAPTSGWVQPARTLEITTTLGPQPSATPTAEPTATPTRVPLSSATIVVRNGTRTIGLAGRTRDRLEEFGFRVVDIDDDPLIGERPHTLILDRGDHPEVRQALASFLGVDDLFVEVNADDPGEADLIVIIGDDFEE